MGKVFSALSVSVDGYITGRAPGPGRGLGDGGALFDWYFSGDTASNTFDGFRLTRDSARVFDELAGDLDVGLQGGSVVTAALAAGLVDELVLHQVPILLGGGRPYFRPLPDHIRLELIDAVPTPDVTHLRYRVVR
jgi:dihydrofolate reductase